MKEKKSVLFVCLGNICRSPMAESVFNALLEQRGLEKQFEVDSAGLIDVHQGELADRRMREHAQQRGYVITHRSRPVRVADFDAFDYIIAMDEENVKGLNRLAPHAEAKQKIHRMVHFSSRYQPNHIPDPYYGGPEGFEQVIDLLEDASQGLLTYLLR